MFRLLLDFIITKNEHFILHSMVNNELLITHNYGNNISGAIIVVLAYWNHIEMPFRHRNLKTNII